MTVYLLYSLKSETGNKSYIVRFLLLKTICFFSIYFGFVQRRRYLLNGISFPLFVKYYIISDEPFGFYYGYLNNSVL